MYLSLSFQNPLPFQIPQTSATPNKGTVLSEDSVLQCVPSNPHLPSLSLSHRNDPTSLPLHEFFLHFPFLFLVNFCLPGIVCQILSPRCSLTDLPCGILLPCFILFRPSIHLSQESTPQGQRNRHIRPCVFRACHTTYAH